MQGTPPTHSHFKNLGGRRSKKISSKWREHAGFCSFNVFLARFGHFHTQNSVLSRGGTQ